MFDSCKEYIITKTQFCNRLITFSHDKYLFMGIPQVIESEKYERNALLFNLVLAFDEQISSQTNYLDNYRPIIRKLAFLLRSLELESQFLSQAHNKAQLGQILKQIYHELNTKDETAIPVDMAHSIHLKLAPQFAQPPPIYEHQVPVPICDLMELVNPEWDLTQQQIIPYINGVYFVKQIAIKSSVHVELVQKCLRNLYYTNCIKIIDIFQFSNMYTLESRMSVLNLLRDKHLQDECMSYVLNDNTSYQNSSYSSNMIRRSSGMMPSLGKDQANTVSSISFLDVARIYCSMRPGTRLSEILIKDPVISSQINARCLVAFGLIKGFLRRVHEYPIIYYPQQESKDRVSEEMNKNTHLSKDNLLDQVLPLLDGNHTQDEICCRMSISRKQLIRMLEQCKYAHIIYK
jgi:hypothetical protein